MVQFTTYEEENIHYWTNRTPGYSAVNQEELAGDQKTVWRGVISGRIAAHLPGKRPEEIRVLDVGTGPGFFAILLAELGYQVTAVDYTASMLPQFLALQVHPHARPVLRQDRPRHARA